MAIVTNTEFIYLKVVKKINLKYSQHTQKNNNFVR